MTDKTVEQVREICKKIMEDCKQIQNATSRTMIRQKKYTERAEANYTEDCTPDLSHCLYGPKKVDVHKNRDYEAARHEYNKSVPLYESAESIVNFISKNNPEEIVSKTVLECFNELLEEMKNEFPSYYQRIVKSDPSSVTFHLDEEPDQKPRPGRS